MHSDLKSFCALFCFVITLVFSYPVVDDEVTLTSQSSQEIYERLKSGDHQAWEEAGPYVVDLVNTMIENGEAKSPVHALLRIFWPELSNQEQRETLERVEPMVRSLYRDLWNQQDNINGNGVSSTRQSNVYKRNPENVESLKEALKNLQYDEIEKR